MEKIISYLSSISTTGWILLVTVATVLLLSFVGFLFYRIRKVKKFLKLIDKISKLKKTEFTEKEREWLKFHHERRIARGQHLIFIKGTNVRWS